MWLDLHPAGFHEAYPRRWVNNIYFDTIDLASYSENLSGIAQRVKIRLRWYGEDSLIRGGVLEMKCKKAGAGWKLSHRLSTPIDLSTDRWPDIVDRIRAEAPDEFARVLDMAHRPILINRYERDYFVSNDGVIRVTLDRPQSVFSQWSTTRPNLTVNSTLITWLVIEAKAKTTDREGLERALNHLPMIMQKHSKYVVGVEAVLL